MWFKKKEITPNELLRVNIKNGQISLITNFTSFQTRAESSIKMIMDAIKLGLPPRDISFELHTGDFPTGLIQPNSFHYCNDNQKKLSTIFPDFIFDHWHQAGIDNFTSIVENLKLAGNIDFIYDKLLWIGNTQTHPIRKKIIDYSNEYPHLIEAYDTCVDQNLHNKNKSNYISLPDHTKYKYLIDIEGRGYSGRLKLLLYTKRLLFIQDRQWKSYYHFELEPYKHFIPVKNDMSDLYTQIEFVEKQGPAYYKEISNNAYNFATDSLTYEQAVKRIQKLISNL